MKPPDFAYERPATLDEALALLDAADGEAWRPPGRTVQANGSREA